MAYTKPLDLEILEKHGFRIEHDLCKNEYYVRTNNFIYRLRGDDLRQAPPGYHAGLIIKTFGAKMWENEVDTKAWRRHEQEMREIQRMNEQANYYVNKIELKPQALKKQEPKKSNKLLLIINKGRINAA